MDSLKKGEKKKNLDRQALEARRAKSRQRGSLRKNSPAKTMAEMAMTTATTLRGWRLVSIGSSRVRLEAMSTSHRWGRQRRGQADLTDPALTLLLRLRQVGPPRILNLPLHQRRVAGISPR